MSKFKILKSDSFTRSFVGRNFSFLSESNFSPRIFPAITFILTHPLKLSFLHFLDTIIPYFL